MGKYQILEHKADLKIRAFGKTKEELFLNTMLGMEENLKLEAQDRRKIERETKISSIDLSALLVDFLSEVLYLNQVNKEIYNDITFKKFTDTEIDGILKGQKVERFGEDIKAVTYHDLDIHQRKDGVWESTVLYDI